MKTYYECLPCIINQTIKALPIIEEYRHDDVLRDVMSELAFTDFSLSPPELARKTFDIMNEYLEGKDSYAEIKKLSNQYVLNLYDELNQIIKNSENSFETALHLAIAGNIIDFGAKHNYSDKLIHEEIDKVLNTDLAALETEKLKSEISNANQILYLGDNAGEIVFDKLFLEQFSNKEKIIFAVRGSHVINDATIEDAKEIGLTEIVKVIDNGSNYPGTVLNECSENFQKVFNEADLIISKGQGNYETLSKNNQNIFFLLKVKCEVVARDLNRNLGDFVVTQNSPKK